MDQGFSLITEHKTYTGNKGDWVVDSNGRNFIVSDKDFKKEFAPVEIDEKELINKNNTYEWDWQLKSDTVEDWSNLEKDTKEKVAD